MYKKYCIVSNTKFIHRDIKPINITFSFNGPSLEKAIKNLTFDFEFTNDFFRHVRFYEIYFNEKDQPLRGHCLGKSDDNFECPNGWIDFNDHLQKVQYCNFFLKNNNKNYYFNSNGELFESLLKWAKIAAEQLIKMYIVDLLEYGEE